MTLHESNHHHVIERHLLMAQRCNALAAHLHRSGEAEAAERQRQLLAVFLHNALMQLPQAVAVSGSGQHDPNRLRQPSGGSEFLWQ